jgi:uncharacterized protein
MCGGFRLVVMRASEADILIVPGFRGSEPEHWQSLWEAQFPTARRVVQDDWERPQLAPWCWRICEEAGRAERPLVLVAHSLGVLAAAHAAPLLPRGKIKAAFLVAPPSQKILSILEGIDPAFLTLPKAPLAFPALLIASRNDNYSTFDDSGALAKALGAKLIDAGFSGHINVESGHGPWREGLIQFAAFLKML